MNYPKRTDILLGTVALTLTALFFIPFSLYLLNKEAFFTPPLIVAGLLLALSVISFMLLAIPLLFTKGTTRVVALSLLAFLTIAIWTQTNILNWNYGLLDGSALRWQLFELRSFIDVSVWILLFVTIMVIGIKKNVSFRTAFFVLLFMQSGSVLYTCMHTHNTSQGTTQDIFISDVNRFVFSSEKNIILLVLDAYQTDLFNEYLDSNPDFKNKMPGFAYYPNAVAEHFYTRKSIPTLLTGNYLLESRFQNSKDLEEYRNNLLMYQSIPALLKKSGYHVGLHPFFAEINYPPSIFGNIADNFLHANILMKEGVSELRSLMAVFLFRIAPHPFKYLIHSHFLLIPSLGQDRDEFTSDIKNHLSVGITEPCFKYYHLQGLHDPHIINGRPVEAKGRRSALNITALVNQMLADFVVKLQEANAYDNSAIFIVADHGHYNDSRSFVYGEYQQESSDNTTPHLDPFVRKCRALPLFLYKPFNAANAMDIVQTPVCLADILPTIMDIAAVEPPAALDGISIENLQEDTPRLRHTFIGESHNQRSILPDYEFVISGFSWYDSAWTYTGNLHSYGGIERVPLNNYMAGTQLTFGNSGNGQEYLDNNWNSDENCHWTNNKRASLTLPLANPTQNMILTLECAPGNTDMMPVSIYINENNVGTFHIQEKALLTVDVPYDPAWKDIFETPDDRHTDDLRVWASKAPVLSDARVIIQIEKKKEDKTPNSTTKSEEDTIRLFSLRLDNTPLTPEQ